MKKFNSIRYFFRPTLYNIPFFLIPAFLIYFYIQLRAASWPYMLNCFDPEYIYLFNGLTLGQLKLDIGHVDNPGTPLQVIVALVTRITHLFSHTENSYVEDVITNPHYYLSVINIVNISLVAIVILIAGIYVFKITRNIGLSLLIQFTPFVYLEYITNTVRIFPEVIVIIPCMLMIVALIRYIYDRDSDIYLTGYVIAFSLITGFGLSFKLDFISLMIIPLVLIPSLKKKLVYFVLSVSSFFVFAFPVLWKLNFFFKWTKNLLIHSGRYGKGDANVINLHELFPNIARLFDFYKLYFIVLFIIIVVAVIYHFKVFSLKNENTNKLYRILTGLIASFVFHIFLISKHFSYHYMMPSLFLSCFALFIVIEISGVRSINIKAVAAIMIIIVLSYSFHKSYTQTMKWKKPVYMKKIEVIEDIRSIVRDKPFITVAQPYDFYFEEMGLLFGMLFTGKHRPYFKQILENRYPDTYIYDITISEFFYWGEFYPPDELFEKYSEIYVFVDAQEQDQKAKAIELMGPEIKEELLYNNDKTGDKVFRLYK